MKRELFIEYLENPFLLNEESIKELKVVVERYPFFQTAHLLYAKALSNVNHAEYYSSLKKTSIIAGDRKILYELITKSTDKKVSENEQVETGYLAINKDIKETSIKQNLTEEIDVAEIILVSNIVETTKEVAQNFDSAKQRENDLKNEQKEKITQTDLAVTNNAEKKERRTTVDQNVDEVVVHQVANAFIEKEYLKVTEIDTKNTKQIRINPEEGQKILTQSLNEPQSFSQWLQLLSQEAKTVPIQNKKEFTLATNNEKSLTESEKTSTISEEKTKQNLIIDKLIKEEPKISKLQQDSKFFIPSQKAKESTVKDETLVTETLAWILEQQGKYPDAINAYRTLSLKYPEKSVYFASLISKIKIKQKQK